MTIRVRVASVPRASEQRAELPTGVCGRTIIEQMGSRMKLWETYELVTRLTGGKEGTCFLGAQQTHQLSHPTRQELHLDRSIGFTAGKGPGCPLRCRTASFQGQLQDEAGHHGAQNRASHGLTFLSSDAPTIRLMPMLPMLALASARSRVNRGGRQAAIDMLGQEILSRPESSRTLHVFRRSLRC